MNKGDVILERQATRTKFRNGDMDFMYNWAIGISLLLGFSPSQVIGAANGIKDGDPDSWVRAFKALGEREAARAKDPSRGPLERGQAGLGAAYAFRMALQYADARRDDFRELAARMEAAFAAGTGFLGVPIRAIEVPFEGASLPGYFLEQPGEAGPTLMMVGGGDTFREDLFYFAGYPGWKRGYNVLMVDLPGQGLNPDRGLTFRVDMYSPQKAAIDWLERESPRSADRLAVYGVSGGGFFTAQCAAADRRVSAWIAATPIYDIAEVARKEFGMAAAAPGWILNGLARVVGAVNRAAEVSFAKYSWQYGTADFKAALDGMSALAAPVHLSSVRCPSLFLVSEGEGRELRRQADEALRVLSESGVDAKAEHFTVAEGADGHCQLNNLRLAQIRAFEWLDARFGMPPRDPRLLW